MSELYRSKIGITCLDIFHNFHDSCKVGKIAKNIVRKSNLLRFILATLVLLKFDKIIFINTLMTISLPNSPLCLLSAFSRHRKGLPLSR
jgi:hypothetical protein